MARTKAMDAMDLLETGLRMESAATGRLWDAMALEVFQVVRGLKPTLAAKFATGWMNEVPDFPDIWFGIGKEFVSIYVHDREIAERVWNEFPFEEMDSNTACACACDAAKSAVVLMALGFAVTRVTSK